MGGLSRKHEGGDNSPLPARGAILGCLFSALYIADFSVTIGFMNNKTRLWIKIGGLALLVLALAAALPHAVTVTISGESLNAVYQRVAGGGSARKRRFAAET